MKREEKSIPPGYKYTEIGIIPEDWEVKRLGDVGKVITCKRIYNYQTKDQGDIPFYKIGTFGKEPDSYISRELYDLYVKNFPHPKKGDVLISASGTIGRTLIYDGKPAYFQDSNIIWFQNDEKIILNIFLYYILQKIKFVTEGGTIQRLYNNILMNTKIPLPSLKEQKQIANVLSDVDNLIESLEKLIEKKRHIKTATMQRLLTPREDWKVKKLGEVVEIKKGEMITEKMASPGSVPVIGGGKVISYYHNKPNRIGITITISASGAYAGYVSIHNYPIFASDCSTISESPNYNIYFIYYCLLYKQREIYSLQTGGGQPHVYPNHLKTLQIPLPPLDEQNRIAQILSDIDAEIEGLEKKLEKYRQLKETVMHLLLSGKVRLLNKGEL